MGTLAETRISKISYDQFLTNSDEDVRAEWVEGEVLLMSPASNRHQKIAKFLTVLISLYLEESPVGDLMQESLVKLSPDLARVPDLLVLAVENMGRARDTYIDGAVDLAVEIISLDSRTRDRGAKYYEYEQAGVKEYWLIDPLRDQAEFHILGPDGKYVIASLKGGLFHSSVLAGLRINPLWFWKEPIPKVTSILKEAGVTILG